MGILGSCCRRRKDKDSEERKPLLPKHTSDADILPPPHNVFDKFMDVFSAFNAGKLPTQEQIKQISQLCLRSDFLTIQHTTGGPISQSGRKVLLDTREAIEAFMQFGLEKNYDDRLQDLLYLSSHDERGYGDVPLRIEADDLIDAASHKADDIKGQAPNLSEDVETLSRSLRPLITRILTSSALQVILSDILLTAREMTAEIASSVEAVAKQVEVAAEDVQDAALNTTTTAGLKGKARETMEDIVDAGRDARGLHAIKEVEVQRTKDRVTERLQEVILQAHRNPSDRAALLDILSLFRAYAERASVLTSTISESPEKDLTPHVKLSPKLSRELDDIRLLIERSASDRPLDPLLNILSATTSDVLRANEISAELHDYFHRLSSFLYMALTKTSYVSSLQFTRDVSRLYDDGRDLLEAEKHAAWAQDIRVLIHECSCFVSSLESDPATRRLVSAIRALRESLAIFSVDAASGVGVGVTRSKRRLAEEARKDLVGWILPKLLRRISRLPMPRVELLMGKIECAIDALFLNATAPTSKDSGYGTGSGGSTAKGLMPDRLWVQNWNEMRIEMAEDDRDESQVPGVQNSTRIKLHLDGVRLSASGIGYYIKYKDILIPGVNYSDEGLLSISSGHGISIDVDIETGPASSSSSISNLLPRVISSGNDETTAEPLFRVLDVRVDIPGVTFSIDKSKHFVLNKLFLQPLAGPVVRLVAARVLSDQLRSALEKVASMGGEVVEEAEKEKAERKMKGRGELGSVEEEEYEEAPAFGDWKKAIFSKFSTLFAGQEEDQATRTESHTTATMKGIIYSSTTVPEGADGDEVDADESEETVVAVGAGAQLFPNKGGPYGEDVTDETVLDTVKGLRGDARGVVEEGVNGIRGGVEKVEEGVQKGVEGAVELRKEIENAGERKDVRLREEVEREGWKSSAFDF